MSIISQLSNYMIPLILFLIAGAAFTCGKNGYDVFTEGAKDGLKVCVGLIPTLIGLLVAVGILRNSGALDGLANVMEPVAEFIHFPKELVPLAIIKMFSSSAATSLLLDIYKEFGTDSYNGLLGSLMLSSTETIMYMMSMYYMSAKVKHTRYTLPGALLVTISGIGISTFLVNLIC
ncbi:MAG: nucleoside recognition domain-containing protein [Lachnospiraceae bacterium]